MEADAGGRDGLTRESLLEDIKADAQEAYDRREAEFGEEVMRELERRVLLSVLDRKWREHLYEMDYLREGIGLRAYSQRDPLVEYQREGFDMFTAMMDGIKEESVGFMFNLDVQLEDEAEEQEVEEVEVGPALAQAAASHDHEHDHDHEHPLIRAKGLEAPKRPQNLSYSAPSEDGSTELSGSAQATLESDDAPTPAPGATRCAPAARARSTRSATEPLAAPQASRRVSTADTSVTRLA